MTEQGSIDQAIAVLAKDGIEVSEHGGLTTTPRFGAIRDVETAAQGQGGQAKGAMKRMIGRLALTTAGRYVLGVVLSDERVRSWVLSTLSDSISRSASFDEAARAQPQPVRSFEDCAWLFSSNMLNHKLTRIEFEEAAYLFGLVKSMHEPQVAEIGRYKGGSTFLLAAAGADVLSIEDDLGGQLRDGPPLAHALDRHGLRERVRIVIADSRTYPVELDRFDLVFVDGDHRYEGVRSDFEHWWPAVANGGHMIFHDAERTDWTPSVPPRSETEGVIRLVHEIAARDDLVFQPEAPGTLAHCIKVERPPTGEPD